MSFDTPKGNENNESLTTQEISDANITTAKEFAENNSTVPNLPSEEFDKYNEAKLLQSELPNEFFNTVTEKNKNKILKLSIQIDYLENLIEKSTDPGLIADLKRSIEGIKYQILTIRDSEPDIPHNIQEQLEGPDWVNINKNEFLEKINSMSTEKLVKLVNYLQEILENSKNSEEIKDKVKDIENLLKSKNKKTSKQEIDNIPSQNDKGEYNVI